MFLLSQVTAVPALWEKPPSGSHGFMPSPHLGKPTKSSLQVPFQNVPLNTSDNKQHKTSEGEPSQHPGSTKKLRTTSQKTEPICMGHFHNRHVFQQQLIERQKRKLQEQQKTIRELKENQRLAEARWTAERATAVRDSWSCQLSNPREEEPKRSCQVLPKYVHCVEHSLDSLSGGFHSVVERLLNFFAQLPDSMFVLILLRTLKAKKPRSL